MFLFQSENSISLQRKNNNNKTLKLIP